MLTFDPANARSAEAAALWNMAELLSECDNWKELCEQSTPAGARAKIKTGVQYGPEDGDSFQLEELQNDFCIAHLIWPLIEGRAVEQDDGGPSPLEGGDFTMTIRRHVRESEQPNLEVEGGLDLAFFDVISAIETEIMTRAETRECPRLVGMQRDAGPAYSSMDEETAQGGYLWVKHTINWGDQIGE